MWRKFIEILTSLKLTIVCLAAAIVLVFAGTMAQVHYGIHTVQERYFQSLFVMWPPESTGWQIPVYPGGHLIGAILLINLIASHIYRFKWSWRKLGIQLIHLGLIIMLTGGLFTDLFSIESFMRLSRGETKNYSEDIRRMELAVIDQSNPDWDQVTAIPEALLSRGGTIQNGSLPFSIIVRHFYRNAELQPLSKAGPDAVAAANEGVGSDVTVKEIPPSTAPDSSDTKCAQIELVPPPSGNEVTAHSLGTWLVSDALGAPQTFSYEGKTWRLEMRPARYYKPYSLTLQKFTHEKYPGTEIPKNFASSVTLIDPQRRENRDVMIYMNHPLRYRGETYYQAGFDKGDTATILQVVHNPGYAAPYAACVIVSLGLLIQFSYHFIAFARQRRKAALA